MRLMRPEEEKNATVRSSALWGKGGRGLLSSLAVVVALAAPTAALAEEGSGSSGSARNVMARRMSAERISSHVRRLSQL